MKTRPKKKSTKTAPLFTVGYEQAKPAAVLGELKRAKIELLVDTRAVAASRFDALAAWKECSDCAFIPVCAGGCSVAAHTELGNMNRPNCHKSSFEAGVVSLARDAARREAAAVN